MSAEQIGPPILMEFVQDVVLTQMPTMVVQRPITLWFADWPPRPVPIH